MVIRAFLVALTLSLAQAFSTSQLVARQSVSLRAITLDLPNEVMYRAYLAKAKECAFSDVASAAEAQIYLTKILEIESGCVSGVIAGRDLCDNIDELANVVSHLRQKVESGATGVR
jgi:hypothetical protein